MAKMCEGFSRLFSGKEAFPRQLTLFSICGIIGLMQGCFAHGEIDLKWKYTIAIVSLIYTSFLTGYEILFMKERIVPDIDLRSFTILKNKIPLIVFLVCIPLTLTPILFPHFQKTALCLEAILAIPLTMMQAGFSYNFNNNDWNMLFKNFKISDYILLFIKRLWVIILAYMITYALIFFIFFAIGFVIAILHKGDLSEIGMAISSGEYSIKALATYMTGILIMYSLTIGTLVWDYEVIKTFESEKK